MTFGNMTYSILRCITVHGTHNVTLSNNVAYNTFGHCYFLEDGGEKFTTFHHNLGLVTNAMGNVTNRNGTIPSDRLPSIFWITSPLTTLTENSAAGSEGVGIWYIFAGKACRGSLTFLVVLKFAKKYTLDQGFLNYGLVHF